MKNKQIEIFYQTCNYGELVPEEQKLVDEARQATSRSYSPYSHFSVGAAILLANGSIVSGSNQENAAFPSGLCAERTALFYANSEYPNQSVRMMAIAARTDVGFTPYAITPCGSCRQVLLETENRFGYAIRFILYGDKECIIIEGTKNLLPFSFDNNQLK